ncbi:MAG: hypothetical protein JXA10_09950 [Anaerolineae bacterium]|nr:hypothetical protein [Anaerolineae bacterium]
MIQRVMMSLVIILAIGLLSGLLAGCGEDNPAPNSDPPILGGVEAMPKQIATIDITPTPTAVLVGGEAVVIASPSPGPPRPTATLTPYVGVFLGEPTSESGEAPPTLAPYVVNQVSSNTGAVGPVVSSGNVGVAVSSSACGGAIASTFANAYDNSSTTQDRLGCPVGSGGAISMAAQPFERGTMYWRGDTRVIYALANNGQFWQVADSWNEGMPANDGMLVPPEGLQQPVRGFGLAWRNAPAIRDNIGWATASEYAYQGFWQDFERGAMFAGVGNQIYALYTAEGQHSGALAP